MEVRCRPNFGFTLAELLIALGILGILATFTIPKIIMSQQASQYKSLTKEMSAMMGDIFQSYKATGSLSSSTSMANLTPYINYIKVDTSSTVVDGIPGMGTLTCDGTPPYVCLKISNGGMLFYSSTEQFGGTSGNNYLWTVFDPDGQSSALEGITVLVFYNGRIATEGAAAGMNICNSGGCHTPIAANDPSWFTW